jgi:hypothetical protein
MWILYYISTVDIAYSHGKLLESIPDQVTMFHHASFGLCLGLLVFAKALP